MKSHNTPLDYPPYIYALIAAWAFLAGLVRFLNKAKATDSPCIFKTLFTKLLTIFITSVFIGFIIFWICELYEIPPLLTVISIGYASYAGITSLVLIGQYLRKKFFSTVELPIENDENG